MEARARRARRRCGGRRTRASPAGDRDGSPPLGRAVAGPSRPRAARAAALGFGASGAGRDRRRRDRHPRARQPPIPDTDPVNARPDLLVSVVVPTRDRPDRLRRLLAALREQTLGKDRFEVIVVADGAGEPTLSVLADEQARGELAVAIVARMVAGGPGAAHNSGWRLARAPLIAFTDDDCIPTPGWLAAALALGRPGALIQGKTEPDPSELGDAGLLSRTVSVERAGPQYETCNIFYPRAALESLGGFDERSGSRPAGRTPTSPGARSRPGGARASCRTRSCSTPSSAWAHAASCGSPHVGLPRSVCSPTIRGRGRCSTGGSSGTSGTTCCGARR